MTILWRSLYTIKLTKDNYIFDLNIWSWVDVWKLSDIYHAQQMAQLSTLKNSSPVSNTDYS